jgi:kynureninase
MPRLEGWWSTAADTRFEMASVARPPASADAWQVSNPPILAMSPVLTSLQLFAKIGIPALRERSIRLTGFLETMLDAAALPVDIVTPRDPQRRGAQLSLRIRDGGAGAIARRLRYEHGVVADVREPDTVRLAPVPLYSSYHDCWRAAEALGQVLGTPM